MVPFPSIGQGAGRQRRPASANIAIQEQLDGKAVNWSEKT
jgi:hypothetical protein